MKSRPLLNSTSIYSKMSERDHMKIHRTFRAKMTASPSAFYLLKKSSLMPIYAAGFVVGRKTVDFRTSRLVVVSKMISGKQVKGVRRSAGPSSGTSEFDETG